MQDSDPEGGVRLRENLTVQDEILELRQIVNELKGTLASNQKDSKTDHIQLFLTQNRRFAIFLFFLIVGSFIYTLEGLMLIRFHKKLDVSLLCIS